MKLIDKIYKILCWLDNVKYVYMTDGNYSVSKNNATAAITSEADLRRMEVMNEHLREIRREAIVKEVRSARSASEHRLI